MSVPDERPQAAHKTPKRDHLTVVLKYEHWRNVSDCTTIAPIMSEAFRTIVATLVSCLTRLR